jgi:hypothetical protein
MTFSNEETTKLNNVHDTRKNYVHTEIDHIKAVLPVFFLKILLVTNVR